MQFDQGYTSWVEERICLPAKRNEKLSSFECLFEGKTVCTALFHIALNKLIPAFPRYWLNFNLTFIFRLNIQEIRLLISILISALLFPSLSASLSPPDTLLTSVSGNLIFTAHSRLIKSVEMMKKHADSERSRVNKQRDLVLRSKTFIFPLFLCFCVSIDFRRDERLKTRKQLHKLIC